MRLKIGVEIESLDEGIMKGQITNANLGFRIEQALLRQEAKLGSGVSEVVAG